MHKSIEQRVIREAKLYLQPNQTFRTVGLVTHVCKSTVATDLTKRLKEIGESQLVKDVDNMIKTRRENAPSVARGVRMSNLINKRKEVINNEL